MLLLLLPSTLSCTQAHAPHLLSDAWLDGARILDVALQLLHGEGGAANGGCWVLVQSHNVCSNAPVLLFSQLIQHHMQQVKPGEGGEGAQNICSPGVSCRHSKCEVPVNGTHMGV